MEEDVPEPNTVKFIPCVCFVRRGVAKENPDKVTLTKEELARVISETKRQLDEDDSDNEDDEMDTSDNENAAARPANDPSNPDDEYNFDAYDDEEATNVAAVSDIAVIDEEDQVDDEHDSEDEDDKIKPTDNLLLVGHVDDDAANLEVFVHNEEEGSLYVHHDFLLPSFPLCIEWLSYDPESKEDGNMCAIGSMDPVITIWDLDIQDTLEPAIKLGTKGSAKKSIQACGHTDAVLDLSWNSNFHHILASASADQTVILWDLDEGKPHTTIRGFNEKVQSLKFHPSEAQLLLTGCCDGTVKLYDCRDPSQIESAYKLWTYADSEIERVVWDPHDSNYFFASTNNGKVSYCDVRREETPLWTIDAHSDEVSGVLVNHSVSGMLTTTSVDGKLKVWKYSTAYPELVHTEDADIGCIQCSDICPENGNTVIIGGDKKTKNMRVINLQDFSSVKHAFNLNR